MTIPEPSVQTRGEGLQRVGVWPRAQLKVSVAWLAHLYTALGLVLAFLALVAVSADNFRTAFLWLFAALLIDATDGWLARALQVEQRLPSFSGARLDDIVDYLTYVFVPAYLLYQAGALPSSAALPVTSAVLISSAYGFASVEAKTADHFFTGFPSYWNVVAFYLFAAEMPPWVNAAVLVALCGFVFIRTTYVYPSRMPKLRALTIGTGSVWGLMLLIMILKLPDRWPTMLWISLAFPAYYVAISFSMHRQRRP